jgi:hypothetical protein
VDEDDEDMFLVRVSLPRWARSYIQLMQELARIGVTIDFDTVAARIVDDLVIE